MLYKILTWLTNNFPYILFWTCVLEGVIGLLSTFLFPPLAIAMIFIGLATIGLGQVFSVLIKKIHATFSKRLEVHSIH